MDSSVDDLLVDSIDLDNEGVVIDAAEDEVPEYPDMEIEVTKEMIKQSDELRGQATSALGDGNLEEALKLFNEAIQKNPGAAMLYAKRASVYIRMKKLKAAIHDCDKAISINPDTAQPYKFRGKARKMLGQWKEAYKDLTTAGKYDYDDDIHEMLKQVKPNAMKIMKPNRSYVGKREERELKEMKERVRIAKEVREKAEAEQPQSSGGFPGAGGMQEFPGAGGMLGFPGADEDVDEDKGATGGDGGLSLLDIENEYLRSSEEYHEHVMDEKDTGGFDEIEEKHDNFPGLSLEDVQRNFESKETEENSSVISVHVVSEFIPRLFQMTAHHCTDLADKKDVKLALRLQEKYGPAKVVDYLRNRSSSWMEIKINIALTGRTGCGKSTLINTLRGLKSDDEGAAKIGCDETTIVPTSYPHPKNQNLVYWDLPGVGTKNFPQESYLEKVNFNLYDVFILVSATRYTELDAWLAKQINERYPDASLLFVRTKIDNELSNMQASRRTPMTVVEQKALVARMAQTSQSMLSNDGISNPRVFMINSNNENEFDFERFLNVLTTKVSVVKQEAFVLSETILTGDVVEAKINALKKHMKHVSFTAAIAAVNSKRQDKEYKEITELKREMIKYQTQLGIDTATLSSVSEILKRSVTEVLNFESHECLKNFENFYKQRDTVVFSFWHSLPFLGKYLKVRLYQKQCICLLQDMLDYCIKDNIALRNIIRSKLYKA